MGSGPNGITEKPHCRYLQCGFFIVAHNVAQNRSRFLFSRFHFPISYISLLLELAARFYERQFHDRSTGKDDIVGRLDTVLERYYAEGLQTDHGIPTVRYCAGELFLSPNYFGDLMKSRTGISAIQYIRNFLMSKARTMLLEGRPVGETADALGFEYPQHFARMFKKHFGTPPSQFNGK